MDARTRTRLNREPWSCILGNRDLYNEPEVGYLLIELIDTAVFEFKTQHAVELAVIFKKWAEKYTLHIIPAKAAMGAVLHIMGDARSGHSIISEAISSSLEVGCEYSLAESLRRMGTLHLKEKHFDKAVACYSRSLKVFREQDLNSGIVINLVNRSVALRHLEKYQLAREDGEAAIYAYGETSPDWHLVAASVNLALYHVYQNSRAAALGIVDSIITKIQGREGMERVRLSIRWLRALLLENQREIRLAIELLDRVDERMEKLGMRAERLALLADKARMVSRESTKIRIANKALHIAPSNVERIVIQRVAKDPTDQNIQEWRRAVKSYIPDFTSLSSDNTNPLSQSTA